MNIELLKDTKIYPSLKVLAEFINMQEDMERVSVEAFTNCREQGFCITKLDTMKSVSFSENRNSDDIVVYHGDAKTFCHLHNTPEIWSNRKMFDYDDHFCAAKFICNFINRK